MVSTNQTSRQFEAPQNYIKKKLWTHLQTILDSTLNEIAVVNFSSSFYLIMKFVNTNNYITHDLVPMLYLDHKSRYTHHRGSITLHYISCHKIVIKIKIFFKNCLFQFLCCLFCISP